MIILKIMALSILIPMWIFGIARAIQTAADGDADNDIWIFVIIWLIVTGTASGAIIETML